MPNSAQLYHTGISGLLKQYGFRSKKLSENPNWMPLHVVSGDEVRVKTKKKAKVCHEQDIQNIHDNGSRLPDVLRNGIRRTSRRARKRTSPETGAQTSRRKAPSRPKTPRAEMPSGTKAPQGPASPQASSQTTADHPLLPLPA